IITVDGEDGKSVAIADGPSPDVRTDSASPGYTATRVWVRDKTPAPIKGVLETLDTPHTIEPPPGGSVCRIVTFPPDDSFIKRVSARDVQGFFDAMGSPGASTYSKDAPHPYMQKTRTLDFCLVLEGEITLVLDTEEVQLRAGDTVVQRGANHAWSNRSGKPCVIAFSSHAARDGSESRQPCPGCPCARGGIRLRRCAGIGAEHCRALPTEPDPVCHRRRSGHARARGRSEAHRSVGTAGGDRPARRGRCGSVGRAGREGEA